MVACMAKHKDIREWFRSLNVIEEVAGWMGILAILLAYIGSNLSFIPIDSLLYTLLNLFGAITIIIHSWHKKDFQPVVLNLVWALVAIFALLKVMI